MAINRQPQRVPLSPADSYNAAIQLHNQEFRTLGERTNAFLIVQSVLIAAFATILIIPSTFPYAFVYMVSGIFLVGVLYCLLHHLAGRAGAQAAFRWRQYMRNIENNKQNAPWKSFYDLTPHTHDERKFIGWLTKLKCDGCLLERLPLPSTWIFSPIIFLLVWFFASLYITIRSFRPDDPIMSSILSQSFSLATQSFSIATTLFALGISCFLIHRYRAYKRKPTNKS